MIEVKLFKFISSTKWFFKQELKFLHSRINQYGACDSRERGEGNLLLQQQSLCNTLNCCFIFIVTGVCYGINSGQLRISYHVGACYDYGPYSDAYTGWGSSFQFFVEEIVLESKKDCVDGSPMVCNWFYLGRLFSLFYHLIQLWTI